jgi:hypothetical protein
MLQAAAIGASAAREQAGRLTAWEGEIAREGAAAALQRRQAIEQSFEARTRRQLRRALALWTVQPEELARPGRMHELLCTPVWRRWQAREQAARDVWMQRLRRISQIADAAERGEAMDEVLMMCASLPQLASSPLRQIREEAERSRVEAEQAKRVLDALASSLAA